MSKTREEIDLQRVPLELREKIFGLLLKKIDEDDEAWEWEIDPEKRPAIRAYKILSYFVGLKGFLKTKSHSIRIDALLIIPEIDRNHVDFEEMRFEVGEAVYYVDNLTQAGEGFVMLKKILSTKAENLREKYLAKEEEKEAEERKEAEENYQKQALELIKALEG